jgi:hypothetical protein
MRHLSANLRNYEAFLTNGRGHALNITFDERSESPRKELNDSDVNSKVRTVERLV